LHVGLVQGQMTWTQINQPSRHSVANLGDFSPRHFLMVLIGAVAIPLIRREARKKILTAFRARKMANGFLVAAEIVANN
jgi:hypothetical protein